MQYPVSFLKTKAMEKAREPARFGFATTLKQLQAGIVEIDKKA